MEDDLIQLNINSSFSNSETKKPRLSKEDKIKKIKQRKKEKRKIDLELSKKVQEILDRKKNEKSDHEKLQSKPSVLGLGAVIGDKTARKRKLHSINEDSGKRPKLDAGGVISSLFNKNPVIPVAPKVDVSKIKETVFSAESFSEIAQLHPFMVSNLETNLGFKTMTAVQKRSIPHVLDRKDLLIKSQTGSGKTLAYAVPIVNHIQSWQPRISRNSGTFAVVIVPTRELAVQSYETFVKLVKPYTWIVPGCIMGGEKKKSEKARIRKGINILVCTPGRLLDHLQNTETLNLSDVHWLVIDEADRLLDLGFEKDVSEIVRSLNERQQGERQTILLSATLSQGVEKLAGMSLSDPAIVNVTQDDSATSRTTDKQNTDMYSTPEQLKQHFVIVPNKLRLVTLAAFLLWKCKHSTTGSKIIVFLSTQDAVEFHYDLFMNTIGSGGSDDSGVEDNAEDTNNFGFYKLYGDMPQKERTKVFQEFSATEHGVLLSTDVAARGLDLPHVRWIIQYNTPGSPADYIHRVGRTARAGMAGQALLFLSPSEVEYIVTLSDYKISMSEIVLEKILQALMPNLSNKKKISNVNPKSVEDNATSLQMTFESYVHSDNERLQSARKAFLSFIRSYATYSSNLKHIFHVKKLHLGHLAKAFGLREAPANVGTKVMRFEARKANKQQKIDRKNKSGVVKTKKYRRSNMSEFSSGFDGIDSRENKHKKQKKR